MRLGLLRGFRGPVPVPAVHETGKVPPCELIGKPASGVGAAEYAGEAVWDAPQSRADHVTRNTEHLHHVCRLLPCEEAQRHAAPETPSPEVAPGHALGRDVVMDDQVR